jgi:hypothetical protein
MAQKLQELQMQVNDFLEHSKIVDSLPDNCKVVVMNHELTLSQVIQAQICEQNANYSIIYHTEQREFTGIVTLRNILELLISLVETLDDEYANSSSDDNKRKGGMEKRFVEHFL